MSKKNHKGRNREREQGTQSVPGESQATEAVSPAQENSNNAISAPEPQENSSISSIDTQENVQEPIEKVQEKKENLPAIDCNDCKKFLSVHSEMTKVAFEKAFADYLKYYLAKDQFSATVRDRYISLALAVRDRIVERWIETQQNYHFSKVKRVYYLSFEYLMGRSLINNMVNLDMMSIVQDAMKDFNIKIEDILEQEVDAGLGNGGLGRLAACFLDSMATLGLPAMGYGLRYNYGIFRQDIVDNEQKEAPDDWLIDGNPWEIERPEYKFIVKFGGKVNFQRINGKDVYLWDPEYTVIGVPYDYPTIGYGKDNVNTLRLWCAKASKEFNLKDFQDGDYISAVSHKIQAENLTKVLYPNDNNYDGKALRFRQQYFFISCSLQDIIRRFMVDHSNDWDKFPEKVAIQLNDTHPSIAIAELMRIFVDEKSLGWDKAWEITTKTFAYTNHTLMPEALEKWPVYMFESMLPRHLQIIYEINRAFLEQVSIKYPGDNDKLRRMSLVEESNPKLIRMAYLAIVGSHSVNGVAELHTRLLKETLLKDFSDFYPEKFNCKTNGITQRRWLLKSNPELSQWITEKVGKKWITNLYELKPLKEYAKDEAAIRDFARIKQENKKKLAQIIEKEYKIVVDTNAIFDVQIKRIHEYKRQLLNILQIIAMYWRLKQDPNYDIVPRVYIFAGKSAPGYYMAKMIIKFINCVAQVINNDPSINNKIKVVFMKNYSVSLAELIIPAADVSEQISTAGMEASGTGNMKLALNGALTLGTLDGANIEIMEEVGKENIFIFGLTADEVNAYKRDQNYNPWDFHNSDPELQKVIDLISTNFFCLHKPGLFDPIINYFFKEGDRFFIMADFRSYLDAQMEIDKLYRKPSEWYSKAIINVASMGKFSSDNVIRLYADEIWKLNPLPIDMGNKRSDTIYHARVPDKA